VEPAEGGARAVPVEDPGDEGRRQEARG
jgi:hypothetical protein